MVALLTVWHQSLWRLYAGNIMAGAIVCESGEQQPGPLITEYNLSVEWMSG